MFSADKKLCGPRAAGEGGWEAIRVARSDLRTGPWALERGARDDRSSAGVLKKPPLYRRAGTFVIGVKFLEFGTRSHFTGLIRPCYEKEFEFHSQT